MLEAVRVGAFLGAAVPMPGALVHPFCVLVTEYVPAWFTVMEALLAPLLHNKLPLSVVDSLESPQLFTTVTMGVGGEGLTETLMGLDVEVQPNPFVMINVLEPLSETGMEWVTAPVDLA